MQNFGRNSVFMKESVEECMKYSFQMSLKGFLDGKLLEEFLKGPEKLLKKFMNEFLEQSMLNQ